MMAGFWGKLGWAFAIISLWSGMAISAMPEDAGRRGPESAPAELIVKYRTKVEGARAEIHRRLGSRRLKGFPALAMERVKVRSGMRIADAIREFESNPDVEYAEPNFRVRAFNTPGDPSYSKLWGMVKMHAPAAWDTSTGSTDVVVAVIDSGIDYNHPDLKGNLWVNVMEKNGSGGMDDDANGVIDDIYGYNAITGGGNPFDDEGHGTHVAGTIGAVGDNGVGVAGVNWKVRIMACKFLDDDGEGTTADAIDCLHYVAEMKRRGVNIVATSNSWGGEDNSRALSDAIKAQQDILFIAAAGNDGTDNDSTPSYPANFDLPNVISVAATNSSDSRASYSQYGRRTVHLGAPGSSIYSTFPGNGYATLSGTSMATPHVSGLAALIKAASPNPAIDWRGIRNLLLAGGEPVSSLSGKTITGRRLDAAGSLNCHDSRVFSVLRFPATVQTGVSATLSALSINCDAPLGPVTAMLSGRETIELKDDGVPPDQAADDGIFTAIFTPTGSKESFYFSSPAGAEQIGDAPPQSIDTIPPLLTLNGVATPTRETSQTVSGTVETDITPAVSVLAPASAGPVTVSGSSWSCRITGLSKGDNAITVKATDAAGNVTSKQGSVRIIFPDGSMDGSGVVTLTDAMKALKISVGMISPTPEDLLHGDVAPVVNGASAPDGRIDIGDALAILKKMVGILTF